MVGTGCNKHYIQAIRGGDTNNAGLSIGTKMDRSSVCRSPPHQVVDVENIESYQVSKLAFNCDDSSSCMVGCCDNDVPGNRVYSSLALENGESNNSTLDQIEDHLVVDDESPQINYVQEDLVVIDESPQIDDVQEDTLPTPQRHHPQHNVILHPIVDALNIENSGDIFGISQDDFDCLDDTRR
jgi:hypothetical protein